MFKSKNQNIWHKKGIWKWNEKSTSQKKVSKNIKEMRPAKMIHRHDSQKTPTKKFHRKDSQK